MTTSTERGHPGTKPKMELIAIVCLGALAGVALGFAAFVRAEHALLPGLGLIGATIPLCLSYNYDWYCRVIRAKAIAPSERGKRWDRIWLWASAILMCAVTLVIVLLTTGVLDIRPSPA